MNNHQMQQNIGSGLTRYRSAPSSYFANFLNSSSSSNGGFGADDIEQLFNPRETQRILSKFMTGNSETIQEHRSATVSVQSQSQSQSKLNSPQLPPKPQQQLQRQRSSDYSSAMYQSSNSDKEANSAMDSSFTRVFGHVNSNQVKTEPGYANFGLTRQSSLPAGLFDNINIQKEVGVMRGADNLGTENNSNTETSFKSRMDYPARQSSGMMSPVSEIGSKAIGENDQQFHKDNYIPDFPMNNWDDDLIMCDDFLNELVEDKPFSSTKASEVQNNEDGNRPKTRLSHHLSLPTSSAELSAIEKLLDEAVPFKIRAKRGCATHPRSIAERVRRTKISERMRKLQELVPNMEKQTNTSHMLDLAVDYIKDLQRQVKKLSDARAKCRCSAGEKW